MRRFHQLLGAALLAACGGRSGHPSHATADAGASGMGSSGQGAGGAAGESTLPDGQISCVDWTDLKNQPKPGETGVAACPLFSELDYDYELSKNCVVFAAQQEPVEPVPGAAMGDCCYVIGYYECR